MQDFDDHPSELRNYISRFTNVSLFDVRPYSTEWITSDTGTYYIDNPYAKPYAGVFQNADKSTLEDTSEVKHYGDFAIETLHTWTYHKGFLGWRNGEFIDRSDSYTATTHIRLWYRGELQGVIAKDGENMYAYIFEYNGNVYALENNENMRLTRLLSR